MKDITKDCKIEIEQYDSGFCGLVIVHNGNKLASIKDKKPCKLWDINKGYIMDIDEHGNFKIAYDASKSKICSKCGSHIS